MNEAIWEHAMRHVRRPARRSIERRVAQMRKQLGVQHDITDLDLLGAITWRELLSLRAVGFKTLVRILRNMSEVGLPMIREVKPGEEK